MNIDLTPKELVVLIRLVGREIGRTVRQKANRERMGKVYIPPDGKRHGSDNKVDALTKLLAKLTNPESMT